MNIRAAGLAQDERLQSIGRCRLCGTGLKHTFVDLGMSPLCQSFLPPEQLDAMEPYFPLNVLVCDDCHLVQLKEYVSPENIFQDYAYFSSYSTTWIEHAKKYCHMIAARLKLGADSQVVEIASNDGYLLQHFLPLGVPVLGVEPAANVAKAAMEKGIPTHVDFFGARLAAELATSGRRADLIVANNCLAHVPDLNDFVSGIRILLKPEGVATLEFPHLERLMDENQFDTIYHEHFSYFSFVTIERLAAKHDLKLIDVEQLSTHGGSLRIYLAHVASGRTPARSVADLIAHEERRGFRDIDTYSAFSEQVRRTKRKLMSFLIDAKTEGKTICGYGAPGKGNTLLNYCSIGPDFLDFTVDRNPYKIGRFTPGMHIPVLAVDEIDRAKPDYILILPWNLKDEIIRQMRHVVEWGAKFIIPIPEVAVIDPKDYPFDAGGLPYEIARLATEAVQEDLKQASAAVEASPEAYADRFTISKEMQKRAHDVIPGGCHTYAKGDDQYPVLAPGFIARGSGCRVWDVDGNEYIEYGMGNRAVGLGHAYPSVVEAAQRELLNGCNFTRPAAIEVACAEQFLRVVDRAEMVKFSKDGSDATSGAVRLARAYTGRDLIARCADHPFFSVDDWFIGDTEMSAGIPEATQKLTLTFRYNDLDGARALFDKHPGQIACLILEPARLEEPRESYLHELKRLCHDNGALFILDEMITGFRWHNGGAQAYYGVTPDLSCFGKALGNGFSVSALAGKREFMRLGGLDHTDRPRVFLLSTTHGAETHALAASIAAMQVYEREPVVAHLETIGLRLKRMADEAIQRRGLGHAVKVMGKPCCLLYATLDQAGKPSQAMRTLFLQETIRRGVIMPSLVVSYSHTNEDVDRTIEAMDGALEVYARALEDGVEKHLVGRPSQVVYRRYNQPPQTHA